MKTMYYVEARVQDKSGLHAVLASIIAQEMRRFRAEVKIINLESGDTASAKSSLDILMLDTIRGTPVRIVAEGEDEKDAVKCALSLVTSDGEYSR